jgi:hypothetical protein
VRGHVIKRRRITRNLFYRMNERLLMMRTCTPDERTVDIEKDQSGCG